MSVDVEYSSDEYGKILYFYYVENTNGKDIIIYSENGLWSYEKIETEECLKYEDVECEFCLIKSEAFEEYKDDMLFFTKYMIINDDLTVLSLDEIQNSFFTMRYVF